MYYTAIKFLSTLQTFSNLARFWICAKEWCNNPVVDTSGICIYMLFGLKDCILPLAKLLTTITVFTVGKSSYWTHGCWIQHLNWICMLMVSGTHFKLNVLIIERGCWRKQDNAGKYWTRSWERHQRLLQGSVYWSRIRPEKIYKLCPSPQKMVMKLPVLICYLKKVCGLSF